MAIVNSLVNTDDIEIVKFIFHIVHHDEDEPILMESTPITGFEEFFKKRIVESLKGNKFLFNDGSELMNHLEIIDKNLKKFEERSKLIASQFHMTNDNRIKPGVIVLIYANIQDELRHILIKYDNESVLTYIRSGNKAKLKEISNTFSKNRTALQKAAIIDLYDPQGPSAVVVDKSRRNHITDFMKSFLDVQRVYSPSALTEKVRSSILLTVKQYKNSLSSEFTASVSNRYYEFIQKNKSFESNLFLEKFMGVDYVDGMDKTFEKQLQKHDIQGEEFDFDKKMRKPRRRKLSTFEGVNIQFNEGANDTVDIKVKPNNTVITITTRKLLEENVSN